MHTLHVVTDSCAQLLTQPEGASSVLTIVPNTLHIGSHSYREGVDIDHHEALRLMAQSSTPPNVTAPSVEDYTRAYAQALRDAESVISIHASRELSRSWANAQQAAQPLGSHNKVVVIDSQTLGAAQGLLVKLALALQHQPDSFEAKVRQVRSAINRVYSVYYVENLAFLMHHGLLSEPHTILGTILGIKPFLTIEDGQFVPIEKVRNYTQAIDRIVEFVTEFDDIAEGLIVQATRDTHEATYLLQERLTLEFPKHDFPHITYNPSTAAIIGPDALGMVVLEDNAEIHHNEDDQPHEED